MSEVTLDVYYADIFLVAVSPPPPHVMAPFFLQEVVELALQTDTFMLAVQLYCEIE